jgi:phosphoglycolate phosphatase-like HAD superfamily hydrolase
LNKIIVFDFDGVICDSSYECLITSWNAWQNFNKKNDFKTTVNSFTQNYINKFLILRPFVKGAGEFYLIHKSIFQNIQIDNQKDYDKLLDQNKKHLEEFKKLMYEQREKIRSNNLKLWIKLHIFYEEVVDIMRKIPLDNLYIATLKDSLSVEILINSLNINIKKEHIFDQSLIKTKLNALEQISKISNNNNLLLIDDNINHLIAPKEHGFDVLLTRWGNVVPEFSKIAKHYKIDEIHLNNLNRIIS